MDPALAARVPPHCAPPTPALPTRTQHDPTRAAPERLRCVVVIEDELEVLALLCDILQNSGFVAIGIDDPDALRTMPANLRPDLFLIDLMLPGRSGIEVAQELQREGYAQTPMIAISASRLMRRTAEQAHLFQATLLKPFDVELILDTVERLME